MQPIRLSFESILPVPPERAWAWATSVSGISAELWPLLRMSVPKGVENLMDVKLRLGVPLHRSWIFLLGVLPVDRSDLTVLELEPGRRFLEQSPMLSMRLWRHERIVEPAPGGSRLRDRLEFQPRFAAAVTAWMVRTLFNHRHAVLRRRLR